MILFVTQVANHEFVFRAAAPVRKVNVAGSFNGWSRDANPMRLGPDGMTWSIRLPLPYGRHQYKFVLDGDKWIVDPVAKSVTDGDGHENSILDLVPPDYDRPASGADGVTAASALRHEPTGGDLNYDRGQMIVRFRARHDDLGGVRLVTGKRTVPMVRISEDSLFDRYEAKVSWNRRGDFRYRFQLVDGDRVTNFAKGGANGKDDFVLAAKSFRPFTVPVWPESSVVYQIFPDRFANGDKSNDPADVQRWDATPTYRNRFGGDVAGVRAHLDYLEKLGIGAVYFTPVFASPSNHRYDASDFKRIDPQFGTNAEFGELTRAMASRGIRTVMDFAFNHTATDFFAFQDVRDRGAASPYVDWYTFKGFPVQVKENPNYVAWFNFPSMPKLNVMNPATHDHILSVIDYWRTNSALGGIRLDVANEVDMRLWRDLRAHLKSAAPNTWIVGEEWGDATAWLGGDQWDSVMGYQFRDACLRYFAEGTTSAKQFTDRLMAIRASYAPQVARNLMNLLSSHDTARFLTLCKGDGTLHRLAATVQLTWPGAPSIYYGEEIGMEGGPDPMNRRAMDWDKANPSNPMLNFYTRLIATRRAHPALQSGEVEMLRADGAIAYQRTLGDDAAVIALNRDAATTISIPLPSALRGRELIDSLSGRRFAGSTSTVSLSLNPHQALVLVAEKGRNSTHIAPRGTDSAAVRSQ